jgi:predicted ABC-type ATPase
MSDLFIIAGPNGAGKTTASYTILPEILGISQFVNADEIARGLSPFNPGSVSIQAGKIMLNRINELLKNGEDFAFETTLSAKSYVNLIKIAQNKNYHVKLLFFYLSSSRLAIERVKNRVSEGGHSIPDDVIKRRYIMGLKNFNHLYSGSVDEWMVFDNSGNRLIFVAERSSRKEIAIHDHTVWLKMHKT